jgi:hypothetical protein
LPFLIIHNKVLSSSTVRGFFTAAIFLREAGLGEGKGDSLELDIMLEEKVGEP